MTFAGQDGARLAGRSSRQPWHVVKLPEAKRGFVPLPRRWVVERSFIGLFASAFGQSLREAAADAGRITWRGVCYVDAVAPA